MVLSVIPVLTGLTIFMAIVSACMGLMSPTVWWALLAAWVLCVWYVEDGLVEGSEALGAKSVDVVAGGVVLFIASEALFFLGCLVSGLMLVGDGWKDSWIAMGFEGVPVWISVLLLSSGVTVSQAHSYLLSKQTYLAVAWMAVTVGMGLGFVLVQAEEWVAIPFSVSTGLGGGLFFLITGFHGLHVVVGTLLNSLVVITLMVGVSGGVLGSSKIEGIIWYWHFVDVVWLFVLLGLYWYIM
uniref:Cytochrome c oxidase subunit 3 n=1 Tax=Pomphorhynchus tereticollis TaxID=255491 RepID=A0A806GWZ5_9BILA|nr:cytochrome c oxidase subunit III [Pomphorhynchus tereticollis]AFJ14722.1 cytochrome c oxidase subunit III [Pomphorhynchus tereticollis]